MAVVCGMPEFVCPRHWNTCLAKLLVHLAGSTGLFRASVEPALEQVSSSSGGLYLKSGWLGSLWVECPLVPEDSGQVLVGITVPGHRGQPQCWWHWRASCLPISVRLLRGVSEAPTLVQVCALQTFGIRA